MTYNSIFKILTRRCTKAKVRLEIIVAANTNEALFFLYMAHIDQYKRTQKPRSINGQRHSEKIYI